MIALLQTEDVSMVDVNVVFLPLQEIKSASSNKQRDRHIFWVVEDIVASSKEN